MRVAAYARVSTEEQAEDGYSIEEQIESIQRWCRDEGHAPIHPDDIFVDDGYSAKDMKRPDITSLLGAVKQKKYDIVVTTKLNRLSRNLLDILETIKLIDMNNCKYVSVIEKFNTNTYIGMMQLQMMGVIAEFERERIAEDVRNTMKSIARKSGVTKKAFTPPCYGYEVINGIYVIVEKEAAAIRQMVDWIIQGDGSRVIALRLNEMGIKTKTGTTWHTESILQLLERETLYGTLVYNRKFIKNGKRQLRPEEEWIIIDDHHPAIIERERYDEMMKSIKGRRSAGKQADNEKWLLSGIVKCKHCGSTMKGSTSRLRSRKDKSVIKMYNRYVCSSYLTKGECFYHYIFRDDLEEFVINYIKEVALSGSDSSKVKISVSQPKSKDSERQSIETKLKRIDLRMQKQIEAYEEDLISKADLKKAGERIEEERNALNKALSELEKDGTDDMNIKARSNAKRYLEDILSDDRLKVKNGIRQNVHYIGVKNGEEIVVELLST